MFRNIAVILSANAGTFVSQMKLAGGSLDDFARKGDVAATSSAASAGKMAKAWQSVGLAVGAALVGAGVAAAAFEQRMRNVNSISGLSEEAFRKQGQAVLDLSKTLPQSANQLAEGLYEVASVGFYGAEGLTVLEAAGKAASAGLSTTKEAAGGITAALSAYGLSAEEATNVSDTLFQTVNLGRISFGELTSVMGDTVGIAATAGIELEEVGAAIATMTLNGVSAAEAGTSLNRVIQSFIDPSEGMKKALAEAGIESAELALKNDGLRDTIAKVAATTDGSLTSLRSLFDEQRALRGATGLLGNEMTTYDRVLEGMNQRSAEGGATQKAFNEQMKSVSAQVKILKNEAVAFAIEGMTPVLGVLGSGIKEGRELARVMGPELGEGLKQLTPFFREVKAAGSDIVDIFGDLIVIVGPLAVALGKLAGGALVNHFTTIARTVSSITGFLAPALDKVRSVLGIDAFEGFSKGADDAALRFQTNVGRVAAVTGQSHAAVEALAKKLGVDLTGAFNESEPARGKLIDSFNNMARTAARAGVSVVQAAQMSEEALEALAQAGENAAKAFAKDFDIISGFAKAQQDHAAALEELESASQAAAEAQEKVAAAEERASAAAEKVGEAQEKVGEAEERLAQMRTDFAEKNAEDAEAYAERVAEAQQKVADAQESLAEAQEAYAERVAEAQERLIEAQEGVAEAQERAADADERVAEMRVDHAERAAEAQEAYAERVEESNEDILRAEEDLADKRIELAEDVADAQRRLEEDRLKGQDRIRAAEDRIQDVQERNAERDRERSQRESDRRRLDAASSPEERRRIQDEINRRKEAEDAEDDRKRAAKELKDAQDDLAEARADAIETERKNREALAEAQENQAKGIQEAEDKVLEAREKSLEIQKEQSKLAKQQAQDEKELAKAIESASEARKGIAEAEEKVLDARKGVTEAERQGLKDIASAQSALADARKEELQVAKDAEKLARERVDQERQLAAAAKAVNDARKGVGDAQRDAASAARDLGDAQRDAADAYGDLSEAQEKVVATSPEGYFTATVAKARQFAIDLTEVMRQGLDPAIVQRLLEAGPEAAAPFLEGILKGNVDRNIEMANESQRQLNVVNEQMVEAARVMHRAITTGNNDMLGDYGKAMELLAAKARLGGKATADALSEETGIGVEAVKRIAKDYGIVLADGINPLLRAIGAVPVSLDQEAGGARTSAGIQMAFGGQVPGYGDGDTVPAWLTPEEYVVRKRVVKEQGIGAFDDLNAGRADIVRRYAAGGFVFPEDVPKPPDTSMFGDMVGLAGTEINKKAYDEVVAYVKAHPPKGKGGGRYGYQALIDYLSNLGVDHQVTSTLRPGAITSSGNLSNHAVGLAADFVSSNMREIFDAFTRITPSLKELFYDPAGWSVKNGVRADFTVGGHDDHVHAASWKDSSEGPGIPGSGSSGGSGGGAASGDLEDWITEALRITGKPESWRDGLRARAMQESSGDPNAQNNWDSNAQAGTPSKGLMQTIEPTFEAYKQPGYDDIWNPVHNMAAAINYIACVPLDSQILTRRGWKAHDEVVVGDETIGYDPRLGRSRWTKVTAVHHYGNAPVVRISGQRWAARATPNHTWVSEKAIQTGKRTYWRDEMVRTDAVGTRHRLRLAAPTDTDTKLPISTVEAELLGWLMGDGSIGRGNRSLNVTIAQTKNRWMGDLRALVSHVPHSEYVNQQGNHWSANPCHVFRLSAPYARDLLERSGYEGDSNVMVLSMSEEQREAFLTGFCKADGYRYPNGVWMVAQNEGRKLDAACLAIYLQGFYGHRCDPAGQKHVQLSKPYVKGGTFHKEELVAQPVWCVTTELGTWTMRQDDQIMLTGNSRYGSPYNLPEGGYSMGGLVKALEAIPRMHGGGMVNGQPGEEVLRRLQVGEGVLSRQFMEGLGGLQSHSASSFLGQRGGGSVMPNVDAMIAAVVDGVLKQVEISIPVVVDNREIARASGTGMKRRSMELG